MNLYKDLIIIGFLIVAVLLFVYKPEPKPAKLFDIKPYQDSIKALEKANAELEQLSYEIQWKYDSLQIVKQQVKIIYREKYIFIDSADLNELDSIIRTTIR